MKEDLHKDNLEDFFQRKLENQNPDASDSGWDLPDEKIWDKVINAVEKPPLKLWSNTSLYWLAAASVLLLGVLFFTLNTNQKVNGLSEEIQKHNQEIEELIEKKEENLISNEDQLNKTEDIESRREEEGLVVDNNVQENMVGRPSIVDQKKATTNGAANRLANSDTNQFENNFEISKDETQNDFDDESLSIVSPQSGLGADERSQSSGKGTGEGTANGKNNDLTNLQSLELETIVSNPRQPDNKSENKNQVYSNSSELVVEGKQKSENVTNLKEESKTNSEKVLLERSEQRIFFESIDPLVSKDIVVKEKDIIVELPSDPLPWKAINKRINNSGFYAGAVIAPSVNSRSFSYTGPRPDLQPFNLGEHSKLTTDVGIRLGYRLNANWSVESGANYRNTSFEADHTARIIHRPGIERRNDRGDFDSDHRAILQTSFGFVEADIALTRDASTEIVENDPISIDVSTQQKLKYINIPLLAVYRNELGNNFNFLLKGGLNGNLYVDQKIEVIKSRSDRTGVTLNSTRLDQRFQDLEKDYLSWMIGAGMEYSLSENVSLSLEPTFTKSLKPVYTLRNVQSFPTTASVVVGVTFDF